MDNNHCPPSALSCDTVTVHHDDSCDVLALSCSEQPGDMAAECHDEPLKSELYASEEEYDEERAALIRKMEGIARYMEHLHSTVCTLTAELQCVREKQQREREEEEQWTAVEAKHWARIRAGLDGPSRNTRSAKRMRGE